MAQSSFERRNAPAEQAFRVRRAMHRKIEMRARARFNIHPPFIGAPPMAR
jgi:hypothetical protein